MTATPDWGNTTGVGVTALGVAAARAAETVRSDRLSADPYADALVTAAEPPVRLPTRLPEESEPDWDAELVQLWQAMADHVGLRTRFFDDCLTHAGTDGLAQGVILAAGLDTRAHGLDCGWTTTDSTIGLLAEHYRRPLPPEMADLFAGRSQLLHRSPSAEWNRSHTMSHPHPSTTAGDAPVTGSGSLGSYTDTDWDIVSGVGYTALAVAAGRAMETSRPDRLITDPQAAGFLTAAQHDGSGPRIPLPTGWPPDTSALADNADVDTADLQRIWETMATYMGVRSRFFDQYFHTACAEAGIRQVVVLAAGLDTRAYRLDWPAGTTVFELDHPNVLAFRDRVLAEQDSEPCSDHHPVGVDLREDWPTALTAAGFDATQPTAWLAEGLLFYLPDEAKQLLCQRVQDLSAPGSRWAIESINDPAKAIHMMRDDTTLQQVSAQFGADPSGLWPPDQQWEPHGWLVRHGWTVTATSAHTVAARYQRVLEGPAPMANHQHPSVLLSATYENPTSQHSAATASTATSRAT